MSLRAVVSRVHRPRGGGRFAALLTVLAVVLALLTFAVPAHAADPAPPEEIGKSLRSTPVYVEEGARDMLSRSDQEALSRQIEVSDQPVYLVVLPEDDAYRQSTVLSDIREATGRAGIYGVVLGDDFGAASDSSLMTGNSAESLARQTESGGDIDAAALSSFADRAATVAEGRGDGAQSDTGARSDGFGAGGIVFGLLVVAGMASLVLVTARSAVRLRKETSAELERVKSTVDEDVTSYGEELEKLDFDPSAPGGSSTEENAALVGEYSEALDAYEEAKSAMERVRSPGDVRAVTSALESGRFALATLRARRAGKPLPEHRAPCFFDPRHGPSVEDRDWGPEGGTVRAVPVCAADAARLDDGEPPMARQVDTADGRRPYWEAGPAYGPWIGGFFGGYGTSMMSGMLLGTMLGSSMGTGTAWGADGGAGGDVGGDGFGGFDGGGFGGGGGFDGGGFGGGF